MSKREIGLYVVKDGESFTGYTIKVIGNIEESGVPASLFEVEMWREIERLRKDIALKDDTIFYLAGEIAKMEHPT